MHPRYVIGDPGYDSKVIHEEIVALGAAPIIKVNPRRRGTASIQTNLGYRLYPRVPLDPNRWQKLYNERTSIEHVNSRLKEFTKLDNLKVRGLNKIRLHGFLAMLVVQSRALLNDKASN